MKLRLIEIGEDGTPARCPGQIPPSGRDVLEGTVNLYAHCGFAPPWIGYLADRDGNVVGACTFKGAPRDRCVEIAFMTFPEYERRGVAGEMARQLVQIAQQADPQVMLVAHTPTQDDAGASVLRRLGFACAGEHEHPEEGRVWQWQLAPGQRP